MAVEYVTCPLCGFEFAKGDTLCEHGCPFGGSCDLICCPSCEYEFPEKPQTVSWLRRIFRRRATKPGARPDNIRTVKDLKSGDSAKVLCLAGESPSRCNTLAVFGLVPGSEISLIQRHPSYVVRIGETELALDGEIAGEILVEPERAD
jgi:Fe2+ transport system protein FeoA